MTAENRRAPCSTTIVSPFTVQEDLNRVLSNRSIMHQIPIRCPYSHQVQFFPRSSRRSESTAGDDPGARHIPRTTVFLLRSFDVTARRNGMGRIIPRRTCAT